MLDILRYELDGIVSHENIKGIKYISESGKFTVNPPSELIHDLDAIPFPDINNSLSRDFCDYMKTAGLLWTCEAHVSVLYHNPDMIRIMADSGLKAVQIGIESGNKRVLEAYNKNITPEMIIDVVRMCKSAGVYRIV